MTRSTYRRGPLAVLGVAMMLLLPITASAKWFATPDFADPSERPKRLLLLPTQAVLFHQKILLQEEMLAETEMLEQGMDASLRAHFEELGYELVSLSIEEITADEELRDLYASARTSFSTEQKSITRKPKGVKYERFNGGDGSRLLARRFDVDAVVYPRLIAEAVGAGKVAMAILLGGGAGYSRVDVGVVDAESGVVSAYYFINTGGLPMKKMLNNTREVTDRIVLATLKRYPAPDKKLKIRISDEELAKLEAEPDENEDKVLDDLEDLLGEDPAEESAS
ncbi:MAG: hypothetical protein AAF184_13685 [Pseudomonadota bacterium]